MLAGLAEGLGGNVRTHSVGFVSVSETNHKEAFVRHSPLFSDLSAMECREIVSAAHEKLFARRQPIFREGDPVRQVTVLTAGGAKLVHFGQNGTEVILSVRGPGEVVALGLRPQDHYCSTAQALAASHALVWDVAVFETFSQRFPQLRRNITHILCQQLRELEERYCEISTEKVSARLSHQLTRLLNQLGRRVNGGLEVRLSREELAQLTGTTLFTVSRLLSDWNQRGIVSTRREAVSVHNFQALAALAEAE